MAINDESRNLIGRTPQINLLDGILWRKLGVPPSISPASRTRSSLVLIEEICSHEGALVYDIESDEVYFSADDAAYKMRSSVSGMGKGNNQGDGRTGI